MDAILAESIKKNISLETIAFSAIYKILEAEDPLIAKAITKELSDQRNSLKMIASENYSSIPVQLAMGNFLTDKYAEGHPFHRFYAGCDNIDTIENRACELAKNLFEAEHAYVQAHSGADANLIAFWSILIKEIETPFVESLGKKNASQLTEEEYETIRAQFSQQKMMAMSLDAGGHLTHGSRANFSSKMMKAIVYGVDEKTGLIDYDKIEKQAIEEKPLILVAGYSSYSRLIDFERFREIADKCGATLLVDMAHFAGLVAGKQLQGKYNPVPYADIVTSTTHKTLRGPRGGLILCKEAYGPYVNKGCPYAIGGPLPHVMAAKAIAFKECLDPGFEAYSSQVIQNAKTLADGFIKKGRKVISGGTDNHLLVVDVESSYGLSGRAAEMLLASCGITLNRNCIPADTHGAWYTSGIRLGSPALTTRGMKHEEMKEIVSIMDEVLSAAKPKYDEAKKSYSKIQVEIDPAIIAKTKERVKNLLVSFPLYENIILS